MKYKSRTKKSKESTEKPFHAGGSISSNPTNPYEISDDEVRRRRAIRENKEDIAAAFGIGY